METHIKVQYSYFFAKLISLSQLQGDTALYCTLVFSHSLKGQRSCPQSLFLVTIAVSHGSPDVTSTVHHIKHREKGRTVKYDLIPFRAGWPHC